MSVSFPFLNRAFALMFATGLFAGLWANDRPVVEVRPTLYQELVSSPIILPEVVFADRAGIEDAWEAWTAVHADGPQQAPAREDGAGNVVVTTSVGDEKNEADSNADDDDWQPIPTASMTFERPASPQSEEPARDAPLTVAQRRSINAEHLSLPLLEIQRHLDLLPAGIDVGDYRIVDPYGGVGWLFVRSMDENAEEGTSEVVDDGVWTTSIDGVSVRFIRAAPQPDRII